MDSHGGLRDGAARAVGDADQVPLIEMIKHGLSDGFDARMQALLHVAPTVRRNPLELSAGDVDGAGRPVLPMATSSWPS